MYINKHVCGGDVKPCRTHIYTNLILSNGGQALNATLPPCHSLWTDRFWYAARQAAT